jgi:Protein of unknown function (DUF1236)
MRNGLLASAAVLIASIAMALAETSPPGGGQPPSPGAAPGAGASPGGRPQGREAQPGQEKSKGQPGALGKGGAGQQKAQEKGKDQQGAQQGREKGKDQPGGLGKGGAGQQKAQEKGKDQQGAQQGREKGKDRPDALGKEGAGQQKGKDSSQAGKTGEPGSMTPQQRTRIQQTVIARGPKVKNVDFSVSVGTVIPRTVKIVVLPPVFVAVYPQYRGRKYFVYNDEIIIVDDDYKIIAVIAV